MRDLDESKFQVIILFFFHIFNVSFLSMCSASYPHCVIVTFMLVHLMQTSLVSNALPGQKHLSYLQLTESMNPAGPKS